MGWSWGEKGGGDISGGGDHRCMVKDLLKEVKSVCLFCGGGDDGKVEWWW